MSKLLILDTADKVSFLARFLEKKDYVVKTLDTTFNLFAEICSYKPDLILLDALFEGDSRELCQQLRSHPETKGTGILVFSDSAKSLIDYQGYSADDCIEKPLNLGVLSGKIKSLLSWIPIRKKALSGR